MILKHQQFDLYDRMIFEKTVLKAPFRMASAMPNEACFLYVLAGEQWVHSAAKTEMLKPRDAILMRCGMYIGEWLQSADYETCETITVHLYPEVLRKLYENEIPGFIRRHHKEKALEPTHLLHSHTLIDSYIQSMKFYFDNPSFVDDELVKLKLKELILLLLKTEKAHSVMEVIAGLFSPQHYTIREVIEANLYSGLSVTELAHLAHCSLSTFKREFLRVFDQPPARYLKTKRLERAADLLVVSDKRISEVAYDCGFQDVMTFSKSFTRTFGRSPSHFRVNQRNKTLSR